MSQQKLKLGTFALSIASVLALTSAALGKAKLPDAPVITTVPAHPVTSPGAGGASGFGMSASELAAQNVIESNDAATTMQLDKIMGKLRAQSPAPSFPVSVHVIADDRPNAHTLDGGNIIVNEGMIRALQTREEKNDALAFILAHEYAHALFNDPANQVAQANEVNQTGEAVQLVAQLSGASRYGSSGGGCTSGSGSPLQALAGSAMTGDWLKSELYRASYGPFSRESETRADFLATDLLVKAGMNPVAGSRPIEDLFQKYDNSRRKRLEGQLKNVQTSMEGSLKDLRGCAPGVLQQVVNGQSLESSVTGFVSGALVGWMNNFVKARSDKEQVHLYYSADERVASIRDYSEKFYSGQIADSSADLAAFGGADAFGSFANQETAMGTTDQILDLNSQGRFSDAMALVAKEDQTTPAAQQPMEYLVAAGTAAKGTGDTKRAITYFESASKKPEAVSVVFRQLSGLYVDDRQPDKAIAALDRGEAKIKDRRQFIATRISVYHGKGDDARAAQLVQECQGLGNPGLAESCRSAAGLQATSSTATSSESGGGALDALKQVAPLGQGLGGLWK